MNAKKLLVYLFLCSPFAQAGNSFGNGGHSVVCRNSDGTIQSAEALDLFEMQNVYKQTLSPIPTVGIIGQDVVLYLDRFRPYSPIRAKTYENFSLAFENEMELTPTPLGLVEDYGDAVLPIGCMLEQTIVQWDYKESDEKKHRYLVNEEIWKNLSIDSKHALVLHEIIYRELIDYRAQQADPFVELPLLTSKKIRQLVAAILSDSLRLEAVPDIIKFINEVLPYKESEGALSYFNTLYPPFKFDPVNGEEAYSCRRSMQDSVVLVSGQWLKLAPSAFENCFYEKVWHEGSSLRSNQIKKGVVFREQLDQQLSIFEFEADEYKPGQGMELILTSQSRQRGRILRIGPFKAIAIDYNGSSLPVNFIAMDSDFSFTYPGAGSLGVKVRIESPVYVAGKDYKIKLQAARDDYHEFSGVMKLDRYGVLNKTVFSYARKLVGTGKALWKGKWRNFKNATLSFGPYEKILNVCEQDTYGGEKCWQK